MEIEQKTIVKTAPREFFYAIFCLSTKEIFKFLRALRTQREKIDTKKQRKECLEKFPKVFFNFFCCFKFVSLFSFRCCRFFGVETKKICCECVWRRILYKTTINIPFGDCCAKNTCDWEQLDAARLESVRRFAGVLGAKWTMFFWSCECRLARSYCVLSRIGLMNCFLVDYLKTDQFS